MNVYIWLVKLFDSVHIFSYIITLQHVHTGLQKPQPVAKPLSPFIIFTGTEVLSTSMRVLFTTLGAFLHYCVGYMVLPWIAFAIRDWRILLRVLSGLTLVYIPLWW